jgi:aldose 1-epimerase
MNCGHFMKLLFIVMSIALLVSCNSQSPPKSEMNTTSFNGNSMLPSKLKFDSVIDGNLVSLYHLTNGKLQAAVTNYGARIVGMLVPDKSGSLIDVVIGFDNISDYVNAGERFFGAIVGRYGNRIAKGKFTLDGISYQLDLNNGINTLHGGRTGFHSRVWDAVQPDSTSIVLTYVSKDGEEGYPGTVTAKVIYSLTADNELKIVYKVATDKKTVVNITNHNFWNLNGEGSGTINNHILKLIASKYTPVDSTLIPTGIEPVSGSPFDFTSYRKIGEKVEVDNIQLKYGKGYDHNFVLDKGVTKTPQLIGSVIADISGIKMDILTTEPGIQFYGGNFMQSLHTLKSGAKDDYRTAFCLETQHFPDSPNQLDFPSTIIVKGKDYESVTIYRFR